MVNRLDNHGQILPSQPKRFGGIKNDNIIKLADKPTVWDLSFESTFDKADRSFGSLIEWLQTLSSPIPSSRDPIATRLSPLGISQEKFEILAECLASLIVRSPCFRARVYRSTEYLRRRFGFNDPTPEKHLIGMNVRNGQQNLTKAMIGGGKFAVLLSGTEEFIFGDGFMHNISAVTDPPMCPRCLIPITPEIAVFYSRPIQYRSYPRAFVINLSPEEVSFINGTVQFYSKKYLFYRMNRPEMTEAFRKGEHMQYKYDRHSGLSALEHAMAETYFGKNA